METMRLLGKRLVRISKEEHKNLVGMNVPDSFMSRGYTSDRYEHCVCFPGRTSRIKPELIALLEQIVHHTTCGDKRKRAVCALEFHDGSLWKAAKHRPGKCPFCDYKEVI